MIVTKPGIWELKELPGLYTLDVCTLEMYLRRKFKDLEDHMLEADDNPNECFDRFDEEVVNHVKEITKGAVVNLYQDCIPPSDPQKMEYEFLVFEMMDGTSFYTDVNCICLFHADEEGAFGPVFYYNQEELMDREHYREMKKEESE